MHIAFALAAALAIAVVVGRKVQKDRRRLLWDRAAGHRREHPLPVDSYTDIDELVRNARCHCGDKLWKRSESGLDQGLHVVVTECDTCEKVRKLYFDASGVPQ